MQSIPLEAFDCRDFFSGYIAHSCYAGSRGLSIHVDCAGAAKPNAATKFLSVEAQYIAQIPEQRHSGIAVERLVSSVHLQLNHFPALAQNVCNTKELQQTTSMLCLVGAGSHPPIAVGTQMSLLFHL
jgi:hypothetical protein